MVRSTIACILLCVACSGSGSGSGDGADNGGANSLTGELAFAVVSAGYTTSTSQDPWAVGIYLADSDVAPLCGVSICPPQTFRRSVAVGIGGDASTPLAPGPFVIDGNPLRTVQLYNFNPGGVSARAQSGTIMIDTVEGTRIKGTFDAIFPLTGGATTSLSGRFDAVMCCLP